MRNFIDILGPDFCHYSRSSVLGSDLSSIIFDLLSTRSLLVYHPLACNGQICLDISGVSFARHGRLLNSSCFRLYSFAESLLSLGGCPVLYPLLEIFEDCDSSITNENDEQIDSNPIVSIIHLIHHVLSLTSMTCLNSEMIKTIELEILAESFNRLSSSWIDKQFFEAIKQLIEDSQLLDTSNRLSTELIRYILLNFPLWNKADVQIRSSHLQYIDKYLKTDQKFNREIFSVQFFLDTLKEYFK